MTMRPILLSLFSILMLGAYAQVDSRVMNPMPDQGRDDAVGFAIDGTGYIVGGRKTDFGISNDLWAYDPAADQWSLRSPFPGNPRQYSSSFVLEGWAYIFCGLADPGQRLDEVWRYKPLSDVWEQLNSFPGGARFAPISFMLNGTAYAGLGKGDDVYYDDLWSYDPISDTWDMATQFPVELYSAISFQLGGQEYIGLGVDNQEAYNARMWRFDGSSLIESKPTSEGLGFADALSLGDKAIVIGGRTETLEAKDGLYIASDVWGPHIPNRVHWEEQDIVADGAKRNGAVFQIGDKAYYFGGKDELGVKTNALVAYSLAPSEPEFSCYPNPSYDITRVQSKMKFEQLNIYDTQGRLLMSSSHEPAVLEVQIDISGLAAGIYHLQVDDRAAQQIVVLD